jgi:hypothetical protein
MLHSYNLNTVLRTELISGVGGREGAHTSTSSGGAKRNDTQIAARAHILPSAQTLGPANTKYIFLIPLSCRIL